MHTDGAQPKQKETAHHRSAIETIGYKGSELAPQVDWKAPPRIIDASRVETYRQYLIRNKMPEKEVARLLSEIRYISPEVTQVAIGLLTKRMKEKVEGKSYVMTYYEDGHSGDWISHVMAAQHGLNKGLMPPIEIRQLEELFKKKQIPEGTQIIIPDDLGIFYEQIAHNIINPIEDVAGVQWLRNIHVALLAGTDHIQNGFTQDSIVKVGSVTRVFKVPMLGELGFNNIPNNGNSSYMTTCFDHKVPDRFLPVLTRSRRQKDDFGKPQWIVDDILVPPPYEPNRFSPGGSWGVFAANVRKETA